MFNIEYIGFIGGFCTTIAFLPQIIKMLQSKSTKDVSLSMYIIYCFGLIMWVIYGYLVNSYPIIIFNSITVVLSLITIIMKLRYK